MPERAISRLRPLVPSEPRALLVGPARPVHPEGSSRAAGGPAVRLADQRLSPHFTLYEFIVSQQATRLGLDNTPPSFAIENLKLLALNLLEPIRAAFLAQRGELIITSGYRSPGLNRLLGGAPSSQHTKGQAADFYLRARSGRPGSQGPRIPLSEVFDWVRGSALPYDQLIYEFPEAGGWLHISYASPARGEALIARRVNGAVVYEAA